MPATEILTKDRREALALIEKLEGATDGTEMYAGTFNQLKTALQLHMREEADIYYPGKLKNKSDVKTKEVTNVIKSI